MRLAHRLLAPSLACLAMALSTCGSPSTPSASKSDPPACAKTFVNAVTSSDPTPGVWDCLTEAYQTRLSGYGDNVFAMNVPLWSHYHYLGQYRNIAMFDLTVNGDVERSVYNPPVSHVLMAVYLDSRGRVDHAKAATPT